MVQQKNLRIISNSKVSTRSTHLFQQYTVLLQNTLSKSLNIKVQSLAVNSMSLKSVMMVQHKTSDQYNMQSIILIYLHIQDTQIYKNNKKKTLTQKCKSVILTSRSHSCVVMIQHKLSDQDLPTCTVST